MNDLELDGELPPISVRCSYCKHYIAAVSCAAFPNGIPEPIWMNEIPHTKPYPGDNGIRYELLTETKEINTL